MFPRQNSQTRGVQMSYTERISDLQQSRNGALLRQIDTTFAAGEARKKSILARLAQQGSPTFSKSHDSSDQNWIRSTDEEEEEVEEEEEEWMRSSVVSDGSLCPISAGSPEDFTPRSDYQAQVSAPRRPPLLPPNNSLPRRVCRLPVLQTNTSRLEKEVCGGYRLQTVEEQVDRFRRGLENLPSATHPHHTASPKRNGFLPPIHPAPPRVKNKVANHQPAPTPPKKTAPYKPAPPKKPAPGPRRTAAAQQLPDQRRGRDYSHLPELKPLRRPYECLPQFFRLIMDDDWKKKTEGLKMMQALVQHHPDTIMVKLHEVCYAVTEEIKNLRSSVAAVAMDTMVYLYSYLGTDMDVQAEKTGQALLLKIAQASRVNTFLQVQATQALAVLVRFCSPAPVLNALLYTGLKHMCPSVRESAAQQLRQMAESLGAETIMTAGKTFTERFLTAVNKVAVDSSDKVRPHGLAILNQLKSEKNFLDLWVRIVPDKDRPYLEKNMRRVKKT